MFSLPAAALLSLLPALISASPLPSCGDRDVACTCPAGTTSGNYTTTGTIASYADAVYSVAGDFYQTDWFGLPTTKTRGPDNTPKVSTRTLPVSGNGSSYDLVEKLLTQTRDRHTGSFTWSFDQVNVPLAVPSQQGGGSFDGYWPSFAATQRPHDKFKTDISWNVYYCVTGDPFQFAPFHEGAIQNISSILQKEGKLYGKSSVPVSVKNG